MNITDILQDQAQTSSGRHAVYHDDGSWTFSELNNRIWQAASQLYDAGVREGDVVALTFSNEHHLLVAMLATAGMGATIFDVHKDNPRTKKLEVVRRVGAKFYASNLDELDTLNLSPIILKNTETDALSIARKSTIRAENPRSAWVINTGSGTTGRRKFIKVESKS